VLNFLRKDEHKTAEYSRIRPFSLAPAIEDNGAVPEREQVDLTVITFTPVTFA
jgi:hypothetical protein